MSRRSDEIRALLEPVVEAMGYELWGLEYLQGRGAVLRLYIDREEGITVDDCSLVSHQVSGVLDVEDPIPGEYNLEISSPGLDRPLFTLEQFARYVGDDVQLRLLAPVAGKRRLKARLTGVEGDDLVLEVEGEPVRVPFTQVDRANLVAKFD